MAIRLRLHPRYQRLKTKQLRNTPVTLYRDYTELARRCEISQNAVGSPKNAENRCNLFSIFTPWRSHGVLSHSGPAGHANRQGMARLAGVQQPWWGRQILNTQWGWQWRGCFYTILLGLLTTAQWQTSMDAVGAPRERNGSVPWQLLVVSVRAQWKQ